MEAHGNSPNRTEPVDPLQLSNPAENEAVQGVLSLSNRTRDGDPDPKRQYVNALTILFIFLLCDILVTSPLFDCPWPKKKKKQEEGKT